MSRRNVTTSHEAPGLSGRADLTGRLLAWTTGDLDPDDVLDLFADLVTTGLAWQLEGHVGRSAAGLLDAGVLAVDPATGECTVTTYDLNI